MSDITRALQDLSGALVDALGVDYQKATALSDAIDDLIKARLEEHVSEYEHTSRDRY